MVQHPHANGRELVWLVGSSERTRVLSVLVEEPRTEVSRSELAHQADISEVTLENHLDEFITIGLVEETKRSGHSRWYGLNEDHEIADLLCKLNRAAMQTLLTQHSQSASKMERAIQSDDKPAEVPEEGSS